MAKYRIICGVETVSGNQSFTVEAESRERALELHEAGQSEFESEEVEVTSLSPELDVKLITE